MQSNSFRESDQTRHTRRQQWPGFDSASSAANAAHPSAITALDKTCPRCGTQIPEREARCAICERAEKADPSTTRSTVLHWLIFTVMMGVIFGFGYLLAP